MLLFLVYIVIIFFLNQLISFLVNLDGKVNDARFSRKSQFVFMSQINDDNLRVQVLSFTGAARNIFSIIK